MFCLMEQGTETNKHRVEIRKYKISPEPIEFAPQENCHVEKMNRIS